MNIQVQNIKTLDSLKAVAFDLDGTIYIGNKLVDGVVEVLEYLKERNVKVFYFTNNSEKTRKYIHQKLHKLGLLPEIEAIYSSFYATIEYLKNNMYKKVYCCGSSELKKELTLYRIRCVDDNESPDAVIVGLDQRFNYGKIAVMLNLLRNKECKFIICNRDRSYPVANNILMPSCGAIVSAIEYAAERNADVLIGKPNTYMLELLCRDWDLQYDDILIVGDNYESDIAMANNCKCRSVYISKEKGRKDTLTVESIAEIIKFF